MRRTVDTLFAYSSKRVSSAIISTLGRIRILVHPHRPSLFPRLVRQQYSTRLHRFTPQISLIFTMHSYRALIPYVTLALTLAANASPVGYYSNTYATREVSSPETYDMRDIFSPAEDFPKARDSGNLLLREVPTVPNGHPPPYEEAIAAPHSTAEKTPPKIDTIEKTPPAAPVPSGVVKGTKTGWTSKINPKVKEYAKNTAIVGVSAAALGGALGGLLWAVSGSCTGPDHNPERRSEFFLFPFPFITITQIVCRPLRWCALLIQDGDFLMDWYSTLVMYVMLGM
ncbi:hypothetical protein F5879DRAFT_937598 [Lentinula edodes]|nr:hypothetical protein F5879DRAFT_937598 [Lentinula edodes]